MCLFFLMYSTIGDIHQSKQSQQNCISVTFASSKTLVYFRFSELLRCHQEIIHFHNCIILSVIDINPLVPSLPSPYKAYIFLENNLQNDCFSEVSFLWGGCSLFVIGNRQFFLKKKKRKKERKRKKEKKKNKSRKIGARWLGRKHCALLYG